MSDSLQAPPFPTDAWADDRSLREAVEFHLGEAAFALATQELAEMGRFAALPLTIELIMRAEREPPVHVPYSAWGERIDEIRVSDGYLELGRVGVEAGVTALPYEKEPYGEKARVVWAALIALWGPSSAMYSCPVAMTDAAARTLLQHGGVDDVPVVGRLTSRDPALAWTSGQWMTEMSGGSDVSGTSTRAERGAEGIWRLYGTKWFTSATTSEMALTLARPEGAPEGVAGLAMFRVHRLLEDGTRNEIVVRRLKNKLGTRSLPTAELELQGAVATPVGEPIPGTGVKRIATMLNLTRIHNALGAAGGLGRGLAIARAHARVRRVFGRPLHTWAAHRATLSDLAVDHAAALALVLRCCELTGRSEWGSASEEDHAILRGLTPTAKLATARWAVAGAAEVMEAIGGVGYCEDSGIPAYVRNTHVLPIWEGTTNVLALDLLRAQARTGAIKAVLSDARRTVEPLTADAAVGDTAGKVLLALGELSRRFGDAEDEEVAQAGARAFALGLASTYACARLCAQGAWAAARGDVRTARVAARLAQRGLVPAEAPGDLELGMDEELAPIDR